MTAGALHRVAIKAWVGDAVNSTFFYAVTGVIAGVFLKLKGAPTVGAINDAWEFFLSHWLLFAH